jgi:hypothetical protein
MSPGTIKIYPDIDRIKISVIAILSSFTNAISSNYNISSIEKT